MRNHTWWLLSVHMLVVQHYHGWRKPWVSSECWSGETGKECSGWALNVYLHNPRIAWLYGPSSWPCSTLASGTTGPGLTTGSKSNLLYIKLKNLRVHDSARMALWLSPHCISYSAKIFSNLSLFLLLVTERKPWVCRATEFWGYNGAKLLDFHEIWESWWFETDSADCGIGCWFPVGFCVFSADKTTLLLLFSHRVWLCNTMGCSMQASLSLTPRVCPSSCPSHQWGHPTISSSVALFSFCPKSFPASGSFPMSRLFASGSQRIGAILTVTKFSSSRKLVSS